MAKKWWEGLLRVMAACSASNVALGNPPRNLFLENPGVGTLFSVLEAISVSTEASLATHVKMKLCVAHCQQSHGYLDPSRQSHWEKPSVHQIWLESCFFHFPAS